MTALLALGAAVLALPTAAQDHSMHQMPAPAKPAAPARPATPAVDHSAHRPAAPAPAADHSMHAPPPAQAPDPHAGHAMPAGTALPAGNAPAPRAPMDHYADRQFPSAEMARARRQMMREMGGQSLHQVMVDIAEIGVNRGADSYRWDAEAWIGGDLDRLTVKTEGEGEFGEGVEDAEVQALYSRAVGPYFNLQAGVRQDVGASPRRSYAVVGVEGLAPYWFEVEAAAFLSDKGELLARAEASYDQRLTQRLILQPRVEVDVALQDVPARRVGAGLVDVELGLRLRYEIDRRFAPYLGVVHDARAGRTARLARAAGDDPAATSLVAGIRAWF